MSLLIKNGLVQKSFDAQPARGDIYIRGKKIVRFGRFSRSAADEVIDANGCLVLPGFVDIGSDFDHYFGLFSEEIQKDFIRRGITTVIGGNFGVSLAPFLKDFSGLVYKDKNFAMSGINWSSFADFLKVAEKQPLLLNFGTMVGYANVRTIFDENGDLDLTLGEQEAVFEFLRKCFKEGAFGVSLDFTAPGFENFSIREFLNVATLVKQNGGVFAVCFGRDYGRIGDFLTVAEKAGVSLEVNGYCGEEGGEVMDGRQVFTGFDFTVGSRATPVFYFLPKALRREGARGILRILKDKNYEEDLAREFREFDVKNMRIGYAGGHLRSLIGMNLADFGLARGIPKEKILLEFLRLTDLSSSVLLDYTVREEKLLERFGFLENATLSSGRLIENGGDFSVGRINAYCKKTGLPLQKLVKKITKIPAEKYGIKDRGVLEEGGFADAVVIRGDDIASVIVNGKVAMNNGVFGSGKIGAVLYK